MKRNHRLFAALALFLCGAGLSIYAQKNPCVVKGKIGNDSRTIFNLYAVENGEMKQLGSSPANNGYFSFAFTPEKEGYYVIAPHELRKNSRFFVYLKPGDVVDFRIEEGKFILNNTEKTDNTPENKAIEQWAQLVYPIEHRANYTFMHRDETFKDFFPMLENIAAKAAALPKTSTGNSRFDASFEDFKKYNLTDIAVSYTRAPIRVYPKSTDYTAFYHKINIADLTRHASLLNYPNATDLISDCYIAKLRSDSKIPENELGKYIIGSSERMLKEHMISNDTVAGEIVLHECKSNKTYPGIQLYYHTFGNYLTTADQKERMARIIDGYEKSPQPTEAIDFRFEDIKGKQVALSDFKGKIVYVDVWATWCGPCKAQIPYLVELEEYYHNNPDIVFISVSVDARKDYDKWKAMLKEKNMGGVLLFAGERKADIMKPYGITGIPRFMLFGKDGKAIYTNAPRPSSFEIKAVIDEALKK